jgi:hypothetical protein
MKVQEYIPIPQESKAYCDLNEARILFSVEDTNVNIKQI